MPPAVHIALRCLKLYHEVWWVYQKQKTYRDPNQWLYLGAGYLLNQTLGRYEAVKKAFQIYTIALRVYDLYCEINLLKKSWDELCYALNDQYPMLDSVSWDPGHKPRNIYQDRLERVIRCAGNLSIAIGNVSARCIEVYNAFYMKNNHEIVIDVIRGIHEVKKQKKSLHVMLIKITRSITPFISDTVKADDVIESIDDFFARSSKINSVIAGVKESTGIVIDKLFEGYSNTTNLFSSYTNPKPPPKYPEHLLQVAK